MTIQEDRTKTVLKKFPPWSLHRWNVTIRGHRRVLEMVKSWTRLRSRSFVNILNKLNFSVRSQSVGPTTTDSAGEKKSPKRQSRSVVVKDRKQASNGHSSTRKQRPCKQEAWTKCVPRLVKSAFWLCHFTNSHLTIFWFSPFGVSDFLHFWWISTLIKIELSIHVFL